MAIRARLALVAAGAVLAACAGAGDAPSLTETAATDESVAPVATDVTTTTVVATTSPPTARPRPAWLGTRVLPIGPDGFGVVQPTPPELVDRRLDTPDHLPAPVTDVFTATATEVPAAVLARSTWHEGCPVTANDLRYVTLPFVGFDGDLHTGELLIHHDVVDVVVDGFRALFERRFPIEEMRIVTASELDAAPTGDGNNTTAFVCRAARGSGSWSQHAHGRAVDVNPFHNPYVRGDLVLPELASAYVDRTDLRPGMLTDDDVAAFVDAGWGWGGRWTSLRDHMHLSANGR